MDEFHFFSDKGRGWAWEVPLFRLPHVKFLLMSATMGHFDSTRGLADVHHCPQIFIRF